MRTGGGELCYLGIRELTHLLVNRDVTVEELIEAFLTRIEHVDQSLRSYVTVATAEARRTAALADSLIRADLRLSALHGVPFSVKDNIWVRGLPASAGSRLFAGFVPERDSGVVARLRRAGAIMLGKARLYELAGGRPIGSSDLNAVVNPWNRARTTGGSSSGSAVAVAAGLCTFALGTDTGGSVRIPASLCGVTGLKPRSGRLGTDGVVPYSPEMDAIGIIARSAEDVALVFDVLAGDVACGLSVAPGSEYWNRPPQGLRIGTPGDTFLRFCDSEIQQAFNTARGALEKAGALVIETSIPAEVEKLRESASSLMRIQAATSYREHLMDTESLIGAALLERLRPALEISATEYVLLARQTRLLATMVRKVLSTVDVMMLPTVPVPAPGLEETVCVDGVQRQAQDVLGWLTIVANAADIPAITIPGGIDGAGVPIGIQFVADADHEERVIWAASVFQKVTDWHRHRPPL